MSYFQDNSTESVSPAMPADSNAKNPANIVELVSADAVPNDPKNFTVDDFLCVGYAPGVASPERPNMQGLYGKGRGV
jgi:hypothetical protein